MKSLKVSSSIPDASGSPLAVTVMVNYVVADPVSYINFVTMPDAFVKTQAFDLVLRVCSLFVYKSVNPAEPTLLEDAHYISANMCELL